MALALVLSACVPQPVREGSPAEWVPSPNVNERRPNFVVIHHTSSSTAARAIAVLTDPQSEVSAHYLIGRDGRLYQLVDERLRASHAGVSYWGGNTDLNSSSIGIELDNSGEEPFAEPQIAVLLKLLGELRERHRIPVGNFLGHGDVAPGRKVDPSRYFPWRRLAEQGFGQWCDPVSQVPALTDSRTALQAFGYDVSDPSVAMAAFRRHFIGSDAAGAPDLSEGERGVLACLLERKRR